MIHILVGDSTGDVDAVMDAGKRGKSLDWTVPKTAHANDRALFHLPRLGLAARAVIGREPRQNSAGRYRATVRDIELLAFAVPLPFILKNHRSWKWPSYPRSYTTIDGIIEERLEELLSVYQTSFPEPLIEGALKTIPVTVYERNPIAKQKCIARYGTSCYACKFSFGETYGGTAEGYIHVHHLEAVSSRGGQYAVDPIKHLRPICPNCHAFVHLQRPPLSIVELKKLLKQSQSTA